MKVLRFCIAALCVLASLTACKTEYELLLTGGDSDAKYAAAFDYFNQGKYSKASQLFESLSMEASSSPRSDTVQYYWGLSNYRYKDYYTAETNFTNFIATYPNSAFAESARFLRIDCLYRSTLRYELDQKPTQTALSAIAEYLTEYPQTAYLDNCRSMIDDLNERLDKKAFESARLYYKMEDYKASRVAFKNVLRDDADNIYREDILYYSAMSSYRYAENSVAAKQKERYLVFVDDYLNFIGEFPESSYRRELDGLYRRVQKLLGRYATVLPETSSEE